MTTLETNWRETIQAEQKLCGVIRLPAFLHCIAMLITLRSSSFVHYRNDKMYKEYKKRGEEENKLYSARGYEN